MAGCAIMLAEKLSYFFDVFIQGKPAHKRMLLKYDPCPACGWANPHALKLLDSAEKHVQGLVVYSKLSYSESEGEDDNKKQ